MKHVQLVITFVSIFCCNTLFGQVCNPNITVASFPNFDDSVPCVVQGQPYSTVISFMNIDTIIFQGQTISIDSVRFDTIGNLPCGLSCSMNKASRVYNKFELACFFVNGTTSDSVGLYKVNIAVTMYLGGGVALPYNLTRLGKNNYIRVKANPSSPCMPIDTFATQFTASCATPIPNYGGGGGCSGFQAAINGPSSACLGDSITLVIASITGANGPYTYHWSTGATTTTTSFVASGNGNYSLTVSNGACTAIANLFLNTINCTSCNPNQSTVSTGFNVFNDSVPCIVQGQQYSAIMSFRAYDTITFSGTLIQIDSLKIDTIGNLPCGIVWQCNKPSRTFTPLEVGCITLSGTTNDTAGQYKINMAFTIYLAGVPIRYNANALALKGFLKVKPTAGAACPPIDTFANNLTASCLTPMPSTAPIDYVWPGDANHDGIVDATDALQISIEYGSTGQARNNATTNWVAQAATDWLGITYGINDKHADCDGNGIINVNDTMAVSQNYSLTHNKTEGAKAQATDPVISFVPVTDTITPGQDFHIKIILGNAATPVDSLYGIAFSMNLDPTIFDTIGAQLNINTSWVGNSSNTFSFRKPLANQNKIDMVLARNNHQNANGYGQVGELVLKTQPHITTNSTTLNLTPTVIKAITAAGSTKNYNTQSTTVTITGIEEPNLNNSIALYPNPNNGKFTFSITYPTQQLKIELLNIQGQQLYTEQLSNQPPLKKELDFRGIAKGIYLMKISTENGVAVKRVVVE